MLDLIMEHKVLDAPVVVVEDLVGVIHHQQMDKQHNQEQIVQHQHIHQSQIMGNLEDFLFQLVVMELQVAGVLNQLEEILQEMLAVAEMVVLDNQSQDFHIHSLECLH